MDSRKSARLQRNRDIKFCNHLYTTNQNSTLTFCFTLRRAPKNITILRRSRLIPRFKNQLCVIWCSVKYTGQGHGWIKLYHLRGKTEKNTRQRAMQFRRAASWRALGKDKNHSASPAGEPTREINIKTIKRATHSPGRKRATAKPPHWWVSGRRRNCQQLVTNKAVWCVCVCVWPERGSGVARARTDTNEGRGWTNCLPVAVRRVLRQLPERLRATLQTAAPQPSKDHTQPSLSLSLSHTGTAPKANLIFC